MDTGIGDLFDIFSLDMKTETSNESQKKELEKVLMDCPASKRFVKNH